MLISKIFTIIFLLVVGILNASASACLASIPYGLNDRILSLPRSSIFCTYANGQPIQFITDEHGGRLIGQQDGLVVNIFGESQALVIDSDQLPLFYKDLGLTGARVYATPNNGPYETLRRLTKGLYHPSERHVFVINLGFDVFRLGPQWNPEQLVSIPILTIENLINWPRLLTLRMVIGQVELRRTTLDGDDRSYKQSLYLKSKSIYMQQIDQWAQSAKRIWASRGFNHTNSSIILIAPYWADAQTASGQAMTAELVNAFSCGIGGHLHGKILTVPYRPDNITADGRHFRFDAKPGIQDLRACSR